MINKTRRHTHKDRERLPCAVNGCDLPRHGRKQYCHAHHMRVLRNGDPGSAKIRKFRYGADETCSVPSCNEPPTRKGMCYHHYKKDYDRKKRAANA